jgi:Lrp/AsnC family transcriptional regulator
MDNIDRRILASLQTDSTIAVAELAEKIGLSTSACWRRVQLLEESGIIASRVALLDPARVNVAVTVFVSLRTSQHSPDWLDRFSRAVGDIPEIVEVYRMSGQVDYLLKIVVPDIAAYDAVYKRLIGRIDLFDVSSAFAMERMKSTTALPLDYLPK